MSLRQPATTRVCIRAALAAALLAVSFTVTVAPAVAETSSDGNGEAAEASGDGKQAEDDGGDSAGGDGSGGDASGDGAGEQADTATTESEGRDAPAFRFPVACRYGKTCFIQNYVDMRSGAGWRDHRCNHLSYDGHRGTDVRTPSWVEMRKGVKVIAAAPGEVKATRDGMRDISINRIDPESIEGREAGNGVVLAHGDGWETQYSHLKRGTVRVEEGERVEAGDVLGEIGLSGRTEFPHVQFSVRHEGKTLDPFTGRRMEDGCEGEVTPLWRPETAAKLDYIGAVVLDAGFAVGKPNPNRARRGHYDADRLGARIPGLTFWVNVMGPRKGDVQRFLLLDPEGRPVVKRKRVIPENQARRFVFVGHKRPDQGWPSGCYRAQYSLARDGKRITGIRRRVALGRGSCR